jgi:hypothetical protein
MRSTLNLDKLSNIAIIAAATVVVVSYVRPLFAPPAASPNRVRRYEVGEVVPVINGISYGDAERSLLMFVNSGCRFCTESMPFYQTVIERRNASRTHVPVLALSREPESDARRYVASHDVAFDRVLSIGPRADLKLDVTPTLLLVDKAGRLLRIWVGALGPQQQDEILRIVIGSQS